MTWQTSRSVAAPPTVDLPLTADKVYSVTIDARLIALERNTGKLIWDTAITDTDAGKAEQLDPLLGVDELKGATQSGQTGYTANLAPQVFAGKVLVGISGAGYGLHMDLEQGGRTCIVCRRPVRGGHGLRGFIVAYDTETGEKSGVGTAPRNLTGKANGARKPDMAWR